MSSKKKGIKSIWYGLLKKKYLGFDKIGRNTGELMLAFIISSACIICVLFYQMVLNNEEYQQNAVSQQLKTQTIVANRGTIYDANMDELVRSAAAWVIEIYPRNIQDDQRDELCTMLSETLDMDYNKVAAKLNMNVYSTKLGVKANKEQKDILTTYIYRDAYTRTVKKENEAGEKYSITEVYLADDERLIFKEGRFDDKGELVRTAYLDADYEHPVYLVKSYAYIRGVSLAADSKRYYIHGTLASTTLGFTNFDNVGSAGLESYYNSTLKGIDGKKIMAKNSMGGEMPFDYSTDIDAVDGKSLVLTIDSNVQSVLEKYLRQGVEDNNVEEKGVGIIMNVKTGAILGLAVMGDYDPAEYRVVTDPKALQEIAAAETDDEREALTNAAQQAQWRNKAINDAYVPGSVFKPITMAAALEEGVATMNDTFSCPGYRIVAGRRIACHKAGGHGSETLIQGMMNSCNPVLMTLGERLGAANFYKYFVAFGLTAATGIDLPGETVGFYHTGDKMSAVDLAVSSFGQSNTVTPIQMITAFAATVNGGYLVQPYVVNKIVDSNGNVISTHETVIKRQVISATTSQNICTMLEATAGKGGTAHNVSISGYRIGAKTGTSEKIAEYVDSKEKKYIASFCAVAPIDDPEIAILVLFDEPNNPASHGGGTIVAPVVRNILKEILPYLGIDTIYSEDDVRIMDALVPNVVGKSKDDAVAEIEAKGMTVRLIGDGTTITGQIPSGMRSAPKSSTIVLTTEASGDVPMTTVPDLVGKSPTGVAYALKNSNLNVRYSGTGYDSSSGVAKSQDIPKGSRVEQGTVITVEFTVAGITD